MEDGQTPFTNWVKMNASTANLLSIIMLIFAAWAAVEIVTNVTGNEIPPVTGMETNDDPKDTQRVNNGAIIGLGAVAGTLGLVLQLLLPREESEESEEVVESAPEEDSDIDEVVEVMMEDVESDEEESGEDEGDSEDESEENDSDDEGDSLEEGDEVPDGEGEESQEEEAPEEEEKTPVKKKKF